MTLAETFDTHIKAISTAEEWEQYKALIKNNKAMKYRVDTTVLAEVGINDKISKGWRDELVSEGCPESWFELVEQVQIGDYWKYEGSGKIVRVNAKEKTVDDYRIDGTRINSTANKEIYPYESNLVRNARKLSTQEIEQALIKEAKRRGYTQNEFKCISGCQVNIGIKDFSYHEDVDALYYSANACYVQGSWAEILDQTPHIEINGKTIEVEDGTVKISCGDTIEEETFKRFYEVIDKYDLDVSRNGEDINEQLQQIWDKMPKWHSGKTVEWTISVDNNW